MTTVVFTHANGMFAVFILILYCLFKISVWEIKKNVPFVFMEFIL